MESLLCNNRLRCHIRANLKRFKARTHKDSGLKQAAVALVIVETRQDPNIEGLRFDASQAAQAALILTRRAQGLRKHAGQWALPGGRLELGERPEQTALRELEEEVGLQLGSASILGRLDDFATRSGFLIKTVVIWGGPAPVLRANPEEVASIHRIPLGEFMRSDAPILDGMAGDTHPVLLMPVGHSWIAAPTAALLYQFREVALLGSEVRVGHYEQPRFAWQ